MNEEFKLDLNEELWIEQYLAAQKIQHWYRFWRFNNNNRLIKSFVFGLIKVKPSSLATSFHRVIYGHGNHEDKMCVWRAVIELRRSHPALNTDTIIKSLIESNGEYSRASVLLGTQEFYVKNSSNLPKEIRNVFLPSLYKQPAGYEVPTINKINFRTYNQSPMKPTPINSPYDILQMNDNNRHSILSPLNTNGSRSPMQASSNSVSLIRKLRMKHRQLQKNQLFDILLNVVTKSYFSKNHSGSKNFRKSQRMSTK
eukprot:gene10540-14162_t